MQTLKVGDRAIELEGLASQRCGTVVEFKPLSGCPEIYYPIVRWDSGALSYSSPDLGIRPLEPVEQLSLFTY
ncbi:hypothetical protein [Egbenema bharatensis]|uniref:hypothetical protein n=1 Tax=Egbenema bharatensis TaxID=3463334 RepID=UPI003A86345C